MIGRSVGGGDREAVMERQRGHWAGEGSHANKRSVKAKYDRDTGKKIQRKEERKEGKKEGWKEGWKVGRKEDKSNRFMNYLRNEGVRGKGKELKGGGRKIERNGSRSRRK